MAIDQKELARAQLNRLLIDLRAMLESQPAAEVYIIVALPEGSGQACRVVCADTGSTNYGKQALETFHGYLRSKAN